MMHIYEVRPWPSMRSISLLSSALLCFLGPAVGSGLSAASEIRHAGSVQASSTQVSSSPEAAAQVSSSQETSAAQEANTANSEEAQILADSQRLFQLAAELKLELANAPTDSLNLKAMRTAAEVEKLAKSLNQRMKKN